MSLSNRQRAVVFASLALVAIACGKKGPPLPPFVRLPVAPANITVERRGDTVDVSFTVPDTNTDRTKPANVERVDVYAITAPPAITDDQLLKRATKVASVAVKAPKDPDAAVDQDSQDEEVEPAVGAGLDQGVTAHVDETLTPEAFAPADLGKEDRRTRKAPTEGPLIGPPPIASRTYVAVGVSPNGRKGPLSRRVLAPLIEPPPAPRDLRMTYTENGVDLTWSPASAESDEPADVLPSRPLGTAAPSLGYNVYDVSAPTPVRVNKDPLTETKTADPRIVWGEKRCYLVRAIATVAGASVESDGTPPICATLTDTFPPAAPTGLRSVAGERMISLIWDPNGESDLAGYIVLRGTGRELQPITPQPIPDTNFSDAVQAGVHYFYAVRAVDKAGNASPLSERVDETARE